jgi:folate-dependent tRNA-U54 methylase TrmFO/GidA
LPIFDVEYVFLNIRAKSVGEVSKIKLKCPDDEKTFVETEIDLTEVNVEMNAEHTNKIELTDEMGIIMTYPSIDTFSGTGADAITASNMTTVISACILQIYDKKGEEIFEAKDSTQKELTDFIEQLNTKQFQDVQKFFDTMPKLQHTVKITNPKTKKESEVVLSGLNDFFG